jgi:putative mRNA 3-end processing factor
MNKGNLIKLTDKGLFCAAGDFYIDPWKPVRKAVVTHAHADHSYRGNHSYLVPKKGERISRIRLGDEALIETAEYGETVNVSGVKVSFHPAGHVLGSAQARIEHNGEVWIVSGDFKLTPDATCEPFEHVTCDYFITEATFGLPIYKWTPPEILFDEINDWWRENQAQDKVSVIFAYSLGKSQRILNGVDPSIGRIFTHGAVERLTQAYREEGVKIPETTYVGAVENKKDFKGGLFVAPPSAIQTPWLKRFGRHSTGFASGWMMVRGARRRKAVDRGFVMSDHADWEGLITAIERAEAETVFVTHGFIDPLVRFLNENGQHALPLKANYIGDEQLEFSEGNDNS